MLRISPTKITKNLLPSIDVIKDVKISNDSGNNNKTVDKSPSLKKSTIEGVGYLAPDAKAIFIKLKKAFIKTPILCHFNLKYHIWIEINASNYDIS